MRTELLVPVDNKRLDWPRKVANAVQYLLSVAEVPLPAPTNPFQQLAAAPATPTEGQTYYDTVLHKARTWNGSSWNNLF